ncbi:MAG: trypsin-like peptidase domain-containing protein [Patescibacteria group bacterium]
MTGLPNIKNKFRWFSVGIIPLVLIIAALWFLSLFVVLKYSGKIAPSLSSVTKTLENQRVVDEESVVIDVVAKVSPSVVSIAVENQQSINLFGIAQKGQDAGIGTGFVISKDGLIMTNKHVVSQEGQKYIAIIKANDGTEKKYQIKEINRDPFNDLAIVKVDAGDLVPVELGDSDHLKVGQKVIAIGNALGRFENTVTTGVVSGLSRGVSPLDPSTGAAEKLDDLIQTDAAINPGNSGGPLVNTSGQVIGIDTAVASAENIGFALKINVAKQLLGDFQNSGGKISRPFLGVRYTHISRDVALLNNVPQGELVREVVGGSAAEKAGIKVSDIIVEFDGKKLEDDNTLTAIIRSKKVDDSVGVRVFRDERTLDLTLNLGEAPNQ